MELLQDPLPKSSGNIKLFDNRSQELPYMVIYVNMTKIDNSRYFSSGFYHGWSFLACVSFFGRGFQDCPILFVSICFLFMLVWRSRKRGAALSFAPVYVSRRRLVPSTSKLNKPSSKSRGNGHVSRCSFCA